MSASNIEKNYRGSSKWLSWNLNLVFRLNIGFFLLHQAGLRWSLPWGHFLGRLDENFVCLTALINWVFVWEWEKMTALCLSHTFLNVLRNKSASFAQQFQHVCVILYFIHNSMYLRIYIWVWFRGLIEDPSFISPVVPQIANGGASSQIDFSPRSVGLPGRESVRRVIGEGCPEHSLMWLLILTALSRLMITVRQAVICLFQLCVR